MRRLRNHLIGVDQGTANLFSDFENEGAMWTGNGTRECRVRVKFNEEFKTAPVVHLSMSMWDLDHNTMQRGDLSCENVTTLKFDVVFTTWSDTKIARARVGWMAIGEIKGEDEWELY